MNLCFKNVISGYFTGPARLAGSLAHPETTCELRTQKTALKVSNFNYFVPFCTIYVGLLNENVIYFFSDVNSFAGNDFCLLLGRYGIRLIWN